MKWEVVWGRVTSGSSQHRCGVLGKMNSATMLGGTTSNPAVLGWQDDFVALASKRERLKMNPVPHFQKFLVKWVVWERGFVEG